MGSLLDIHVKYVFEGFFSTLTHHKNVDSNCSKKELCGQINLKNTGLTTITVGFSAVVLWEGL